MVPLGLLAAGSYFIGAVPFSLIIGKLRGVDIRTEGSGNIGAANVWRTAGAAAGMTAFACDMGKGVLAVLLAHAGSASRPDDLLLIAVIAAVVGHVFPVYLKFKGGKGVATGAGAMLALSPAVLLSAAGVYIIAFVCSRRTSSVGSLAGALSFPVFLTAYYLFLPGVYAVFFKITYAYFLVTSILVIAIIVVRHSANLRKLFSGKEAGSGTAG
ncbi:MAG: glycerol-3-phosphate 1-O-acyltransferase PlsY [Planctomycetota bacterium]